MRNRILAGLLNAALLLGIGVAGSYTISSSSAEQQEQVPQWWLGKSVFKVVTPIFSVENGKALASATGSAFLVDRGGQHGVGFMTAWHVVAEVKGPVTVQSEVEGLSVEFKRIGLTDMAWAPVKEVPFGWKPLAVGKPRLNRMAFVWGFPRGTHLGVSSGKVLAYQAELIGKVFEREGKYVSMDAIINPGCSGGPVISEDGTVIGVAVIGSDMGPFHTFFVEIPA